MINFATDFVNKNGCIGEMRSAFEQVNSRDSIDVVVLHAEWANYIQGYRWPETLAAAYIFDKSGQLNHEYAAVETNAKFFEEALIYTLESLRKSNKKVIIVLPIPEHELDVRLVAARAAALDSDANIFALNLQRYQDRSGVVRDLLVKYGLQFKARIVDPVPAFCSNSSCKIVDEGGRALYTDSNHLSYVGAQLLAPVIVEAIEAALAD